MATSSAPATAGSTSVPCPHTPTRSRTQPTGLSCESGGTRASSSPGRAARGRRRPRNLSCASSHSPAPGARRRPCRPWSARSSAPSPYSRPWAMPRPCGTTTPRASASTLSCSLAGPRNDDPPSQLRSVTRPGPAALVARASPGRRRTATSWRRCAWSAPRMASAASTSSTSCWRRPPGCMQPDPALRRRPQRCGALQGRRRSLSRTSSTRQAATAPRTLPTSRAPCVRT
mmetsp:Transcript_64136/g.191128  ORF Transcript_64136/g.191128 Transcript_64136/m.191128 type:complete len:230 (-) Transcript_64136:576-1265(-)